MAAVQVEMTTRDCLHRPTGCHVPEHFLRVQRGAQAFHQEISRCVGGSACEDVDVGVEVELEDRLDDSNRLASTCHVILAELRGELQQDAVSPHAPDISPVPRLRIPPDLHVVSRQDRRSPLSKAVDVQREVPAFRQELRIGHVSFVDDLPAARHVLEYNETGEEGHFESCSGDILSIRRSIAFSPCFREVTNPEEDKLCSLNTTDPGGSKKGSLRTKRLPIRLSSSRRQQRSDTLRVMLKF
eukprot:755723-Hanusia_phi.AAC.1